MTPAVVYLEDLPAVILDDEVMPQHRTAVLQKCAGLAPYVGDPFAYVWYVAVNDGRELASTEAVIRYRPKD
jgi:hypothetical protein